MSNGIPLIIGILFGFIAQVMVFFQLQGPMKYEWFKNNYWITVLMGIPISMLFMYISWNGYRTFRQDSSLDNKSY